MKLRELLCAVFEKTTKIGRRVVLPSRRPRSSMPCPGISVLFLAVNKGSLSSLPNQRRVGECRQDGAHRRAQHGWTARGFRYPVEKLNTAANLILLCATCHDRVDAFPCQFNVRVLRQMKLDHEAQFMDRPETK